MKREARRKIFAEILSKNSADYYSVASVSFYLRSLLHKRLTALKTKK